MLDGHNPMPEAQETKSINAPPWLSELTAEDLHFIRRFVIASGSFKAIAAEYGVSYPTVRGRLDRLITKIHAAENAQIRDPFDRTLRVLVAEGAISDTVARRLFKAHQATKTLTQEKKR